MPFVGLQNWPFWSEQARLRPCSRRGQQIYAMEEEAQKRKERLRALREAAGIVAESEKGVDVSTRYDIPEIGSGRAT